MRLKRCVFLLLAGLSVQAGLSANVYAEKADRDKPTQVDSDQLNHDDQRQMTIFTGNVVLTKGTILLRGDRLEMWQDPAGNYFGIMIGRPSVFRQKREGLNEFMDGEGQRIDYNGFEEIVVLTGNAIMRRLEGDVLKDQVSGDRLTYNNITERYTVESGDTQGRSRMFLMPKADSKPLPRTQFNQERSVSPGDGRLVNPAGETRKAIP